MKKTEISKKDWVTLRLLVLIGRNAPHLCRHPETIRSVIYITNTYKRSTYNKAIDLIKKEQYQPLGETK